MDDRVLRKLAAGAEHDRRVADRAVEAVASMRDKITRAEAALKSAELAEAEAERQAESAVERAGQSEAAYREAADGVGVVAEAAPAAATGKAK